MRCLGYTWLQVIKLSFGVGFRVFGAFSGILGGVRGLGGVNFLTIKIDTITIASLCYLGGAFALGM